MANVNAKLVSAVLAIPAIYQWWPLDDPNFDGDGTLDNFISDVEDGTSSNNQVGKGPGAASRSLIYQGDAGGTKYIRQTNGVNLAQAEETFLCWFKPTVDNPTGTYFNYYLEDDAIIALWRTAEDPDFLTVRHQHSGGTIYTEWHEVDLLAGVWYMLGLTKTGTTQLDLIINDTIFVGAPVALPALVGVQTRIHLCSLTMTADRMPVGTEVAHFMRANAALSADNVSDIYNAVLEPFTSPNTMNKTNSQARLTRRARKARVAAA